MKVVMVMAALLTVSLLGGCVPLIAGGVAGAIVAHEVGKPYTTPHVCDRYGRCYYRR